MIDTVLGNIICLVCLLWFLHSMHSCKGTVYIDGKKHTVEVPYTEEVPDER